MNTSATIRVATRGSALARWQAERVISMLDRPAELVIVSTRGDDRRDVEIHRLGGTGVFVKEVEQAVLDGRADLAVHSAKDLPSTTADGLVLAAVPERADPRDALVGSSLDGLATGALVATGSVRRRAQLAAYRPDLRFTGLRGNVETRIARAGGVDGVDAVVVAVAALERLGRRAEATEVLDPSVMLPQVAQGALAVECRADDSETIERVAAIDDAASHRCVLAERAFLAELGGGCDLPVGALARLVDDELVMTVLLSSLDGRVVVRAHARGKDALTTGRGAAAELLDGAGGRSLLDVVLPSRATATTTPAVP